MRIFILLIFLLVSVDYLIAEGESSLAKQSQNPVADLISVPFQNNINFNIGRHDRTQNILNIQPVAPFNLTENWNLITRTIAPVIYQPDILDDSGGEFGLGDINTTWFLSPAPKAKGQRSTIRLLVCRMLIFPGRAVPTLQGILAIGVMT